MEETNLRILISLVRLNVKCPLERGEKNTSDFARDNFPCIYILYS